MNLSTSGLSLAAGAAIDLHLHTIYDGTWPPELLLDHLVEKQFSLVAIADHDRTDKVAEIQQQGLEKHLPVLAAVVMTCIWIVEMVDLLYYGFDPGPSDLADLAQDILRRQQENTREVFANLQQHLCIRICLLQFAGIRNGQPALGQHEPVGAGGRNGRSFCRQK
jgi:predicted metal-dependent phosphoesterase TrpH